MAPGNAEQASVVASHFIHWYVNETGGVPAHDPIFPDSDCPTCGVPEIHGGDVFDGGRGATGPTGVETASLLPSAFVAVTWKRSMVPTSAVPGVYDAFVAPVTGAHPFPLESQRSH